MAHRTDNTVINLSKASDMEKSSLIYIAGHRGLVGSAITRGLRKRGFTNLLLKSHDELNLIDQSSTKQFFSEYSPNYVFLAAAKVGGILANSTFPAEFIYNNLMIECNVIHQSYLSGVKKILFLGSSCIYPKHARQPMVEDEILTGKLEPTNEPYAIAKIAGMKMCDYYRRQFGADFISAMPTNIYGPGDNFDLMTSHALPALIRKFHEAKMKCDESVKVWGTGAPRREFLFVDDLADALIFLMENYSQEGPVNVGTGEDIAISELAKLIQSLVDFQGRIEYDTTKPDGTPRKLLDVTKMNELGWQASTGLREGLEKTYRWFLEYLVEQ